MSARERIANDNGLGSLFLADVDCEYERHFICVIAADRAVAEAAHSLGRSSTFPTFHGISVLQSASNRGHSLREWVVRMAEAEDIGTCQQHDVLGEREHGSNFTTVDVFHLLSNLVGIK